MNMKRIIIGGVILSALFISSHSVLAANGPSCSGLYVPGSVQAVMYGSSTEAVSGTSYPITAVVRNFNKYPVTDGTLYVKVVKLDAGAATGSDAYQTVDQFVAESGMNLVASETRNVSFAWNVPAYAVSGSYEVLPYFVSAGRFDMLGSSENAADHGVPLDITVRGEVTAGVAFDRSSVTVDGAPYALSSVKSVGASDRTLVTATLVNATDARQTVTVTEHVYRSSVMNPVNELRSSTAEVTIAPKSSQKISFAVDDQVPSTIVVLEADYKDAKSILNVRVDRPELARPTIEFASIAGYPLAAGAPFTYFGCVASPDAGSKLVLTLADGRGSVIDSHSFDLSATGSAALASTFAPRSPSADLMLRADLYRDGRVIDTAIIPYACSALDSSICGSGSDATLPILYFVVTIASLIVALALWKLVRRGKSGPAVIIVLFVLAAGGAALSPSQASAAQVSSVYGNTVYGYQNITCTGQTSPVSTVKVPSGVAFQSCSYNYDKNNTYTPGGEPKSSYDPSTGTCTAWFVCDGGVYGKACSQSGWCDGYIVQARIDYTQATPSVTPPPTIVAPAVSGPTSREVNQAGDYTVSGEKLSNGDPIDFQVSFADGNGAPTVDQTLGPISLDTSKGWLETVSAATLASAGFQKSWATTGVKTIRVRTVDASFYSARGNGSEVYASTWSAPLAVNVTQTPAPVNDTVTVQISGTGQGTVTSDVGGINCSTGGTGTCSTTVADGTTVTLSAAAGAGSAFTGWSGPCSGTGACSIKVIGPASVVATFDAPTPVSPAGISTTLSVSKNQINAGGSVVATGFAHGTGVRYFGLEARYTTNGSTYQGWWNWGIWCQNDPACPVDTAETLTPSFAQPGTYELRTYAAGADQSYVYSSPATVIVSTPANANANPAANSNPTNNGTTGAAGNPPASNPTPQPAFNISVDPNRVNAKSVAGYSGAIEDGIRLSVNPVSGFDSPVTITVDQSTIPAGIKPQFSFDGGKTWSANPRGDMTWDGSNYYRDPSGLIYLPIRIKFDGVLAPNQSYPITFDGAGGTGTAQATLYVDSKPVQPNFQER